ncbi:MAG: hypothetical protein MK102_16100 [Fuerstiella sp.]|nr:hypothetical protein [Fuerstiella sp.]
MSLWNGFLGLMLLAVCANGSAARAQQTSGDEVAGVDSTKNKQILVLKSGRVVKGNIRPRGTGYDIDQKNGQMFVGSEQVWLLADDLPQAHQTIRDSFAVLTPDIHMQIASWCSNHQLWGTARRELLDALHLDPYREDARRMLARVVRLQNQTHESSPADAAQPPQQDVAIQMALPRRSLGGLSFELAGEFTRRIQPLLSNKCASCHRKGSGRTFVMESIHKGSNPQIAARNLTTILEQIDSAAMQPNQFLEMAMTRHGSMKADPFARRVGTVQRDRLRSWVDGVRREKTMTSTRQSASFADTALNVAGNLGPEVLKTRHQRDSSRRVVTSIDPDGALGVTNRVAKTAEGGILDDARRRNRIDKFDPEIFNQRYRVPAK